MKPCVLYERECIDCNECERCDLDPEKICDNCCVCIATEGEYNEVIIDEMLMDDELEDAFNKLSEDEIEAIKLFAKDNFYE